MTNIDRLAQIVSDSESIVFFGGAGVSTESGIPDFRSAHGIFSAKGDIPPEVIVSHDYFMLHTDKFYEFYRSKMLFPSAQPNSAHRYLAKLEQVGKLKAVVTQNIDGLHQAAGSTNVYELHGSIHRNHCMRCGRSFELKRILDCDGVPHCDCGGLIKPDVVLYGEGLDDEIVSGAIEAIAHADTLIIGGTSLTVYPAAAFIDYFSGRHLVIINKSATSADRMAELTLSDSIGEVFEALDQRNII